MIRLVILLLRRRWGLIIVGAIVLIGGLLYGANSHSVAYKSVGQGSVAHFLSNDSDSTSYLQMAGSPTLYILNKSDFTPAINSTNIFGDGDNISFVYRTDSTSDIDQTSTIGTHLVGPAYTVIEFTVFSNNGQQAFTTSDYAKNPNGFYQNNWLAGGTIAVIGLIIAGLAFVLPSLRKKKQPAFNTPATGMQGVPNPYQQPFQQPYQQPYVAPTGYEQYSPQQPNQYPPSPFSQPNTPNAPNAPNAPNMPYSPYASYGQAQPGQYEPTQIANPYNQPPQQ